MPLPYPLSPQDQEYRGALEEDLLIAAEEAFAAAIAAYPAQNRQAACREIRDEVLQVLCESPINGDVVAALRFRALLAACIAGMAQLNE